jgi:hypothetical protein
MMIRCSEKLDRFGLIFDFSDWLIQSLIKSGQPSWKIIWSKSILMNCCNYSEDILDTYNAAGVGIVAPDLYLHVLKTKRSEFGPILKGFSENFEYKSVVYVPICIGTEICCVIQLMTREPNPILSDLMVENSWSFDLVHQICSKLKSDDSVTHDLSENRDSVILSNEFLSKLLTFSSSLDISDISSYYTSLLEVFYDSLKGYSMRAIGIYFSKADIDEFFGYVMFGEDSSRSVTKTNRFYLIFLFYYYF